MYTRGGLLPKILLHVYRLDLETYLEGIFYQYIKERREVSADLRYLQDSFGFDTSFLEKHKNGKYTVYKILPAAIDETTTYVMQNRNDNPAYKDLQKEYFLDFGGKDKFYFRQTLGMIEKYEDFFTPQEVAYLQQRAPDEFTEDKISFTNERMAEQSEELKKIAKKELKEFYKTLPAGASKRKTSIESLWTPIESPRRRTPVENRFVPQELPR